MAKSGTHFFSAEKTPPRFSEAAAGEWEAAAGEGEKETDRARNRTVTVIVTLPEKHVGLTKTARITDDVPNRYGRARTNAGEEGAVG